MTKIESFKEWLKEINNEENYFNVKIDEKQHHPIDKTDVWLYKVCFYTDSYEYEIFVTDPNYADGNLSCLVTCRKERAGEGWLRRDLIHNEKLTYESWNKLKNKIINYEMVKLEPNSNTEGSTHKDWYSNKVTRKD